MTIMLTPLVCPCCGAPLNDPPDSGVFFCSHCGSKLLASDDSIRIEIDKRATTQIVDEAKVIEAKRQTLITKSLITAFALLFLASAALVLFISLKTNGGGEATLFAIGFLLIGVAVIISIIRAK